MYRLFDGLRQLSLVNWVLHKKHIHQNLHAAIYDYETWQKPNGRGKKHTQIEQGHGNLASKWLVDVDVVQILYFFKKWVLALQNDDRKRNSLEVTVEALNGKKALFLYFYWPNSHARNANQIDAIYQSLLHTHKIQKNNNNKEQQAINTQILKMIQIKIEYLILCLFTLIHFFIIFFSTFANFDDAQTLFDMINFPCIAPAFNSYKLWWFLPLFFGVWTFHVNCGGWT